MGLRVSGLEFRDQGLEFRVLGIRVYGLMGTNLLAWQGFMGSISGGL